MCCVVQTLHQWVRAAPGRPQGRGIFRGGRRGGRGGRGGPGVRSGLAPSDPPVEA